MTKLREVTLKDIVFTPEQKKAISEAVKSEGIIVVFK